MEQFYLIDTNIVSKYIAASFSDKAMSFLDDIINATPHLSIITQIELLSWKTIEATEVIINNFISDSDVIDLTPTIVEICVGLRRNKNIKTPDAIIAATALQSGYVLITANEKDFANIKGLKIINPHKL